MIQITCTHCKADLTIDDAFAGGVCRCQYCGTIQTVPKRLKNGAAGSTAKASVGNGEAKSLYQRKSRDTGLSSGLDAVADAVSSSGLSGSALTGSGLSRKGLTGSGLGSASLRRADASGGPMPPAPQKNKLIPILLVAGIAIILLLGVIIGILIKGSGGDQSGATGQPPGSSAPNTLARQSASNTPDAARTDEAPSVVSTAPPAPKIVGFYGLTLNEPTVIFLIDRGDATKFAFDSMQKACLNAIDGLKPEQKYQVIFWKLASEKDPLMIPKSPVAAGDKNELKKTDQNVSDVTSYGSTDLGPTVEKALSFKPSAIVIATGRPLDSSFSKTVLDARKKISGKTKIHCVALVEHSSDAAMREVAKGAGGQYKYVTLAELNSVTR